MAATNNNNNNNAEFSFATPQSSLLQQTQYQFQAHHATPTRKTPQHHPPRPAHVASSNLTPAGRRRKQQQQQQRKPNQDKPPHSHPLHTSLPESALYTALLDLESKIDSALNAKKIDIQEAIKLPRTVSRTVRFYVFNTFSNQSPLEPSSWTLRIVGRILDDGNSNFNSNPSSSFPLPKFSSFFKRITVQLDPSLYPENHTIVWENLRSPSPVEGFEIKRKGDNEFTAKICLEINNVPEKFRLSSSLADLLGREIDTRPRIIASLWHYVKSKGLNSPSDPSVVICDSRLQNLFGEETIKFSGISQKLSQHLSAPEPIQLEHTIQLTGNSPAGLACYDVLVDLPVPLQGEMAAFLSNVEKNRGIEECEEGIRSALREIEEHRRRRAFYLGFSQSPVETINAMIASQSRDLRGAAADASGNAAQKERRSDFYSQPWAEDAVIRYMNHKPAAGNDATGNT